MWPLPAAGGPSTSGTSGVGRGIRVPGSQRTRVRGLPSVLGEFPAAALAEEIDTPSDDGGRLRGLITIAGNPVVSTPDAGRLDAALATLDVMVSIDAYLTETSRHAHVVLPAPSPLARGSLRHGILQPVRAQRRSMDAADTGTADGRRGGRARRGRRAAAPGLRLRSGTH